jgi:hypothetical protein
LPHFAQKIVAAAYSQPWGNVESDNRTTRIANGAWQNASTQADASLGEATAPLWRKIRTMFE